MIKPQEFYRKLIDEGPIALTSEERIVWTRYLMAQRARTPAIVKHIRNATNKSIRHFLMEQQNETYLAIRRNIRGNLPPSALEWFDQKWPGRRANMGLEILMRVIPKSGVFETTY